MTHTEKIQAIKTSYQKVKQIASKDLAYITEQADLSPFYKYAPRIESFAKVIEDKKNDSTDRRTLVEVLKGQYSRLDTAGAVENNILKLLDSRTFTVTTAHQPCLFTGPLYYIFKIISTINLAERLSAAYPDYAFVPVFVSGGEDHDFEEVNHLHLFNKTLRWENTETGSVGMMKTASLQAVLAELKEILGETPQGQEIFDIINHAHTRHEIYSDAVIEMLHKLFGDYGLVVLNMNHKKLKKLFADVMKEEIFEQNSFSLVNETIEKLNKKGFSTQANPRDINLFYLKDQMRERIEEADGIYKIVNTNLTFTKAEMLEELENHPERFSPNVVMRPLFQEKILPNLAYVGGGGEIAYWLERKKQFEHFGINFPVLIRRNSAMLLDENTYRRIQKLGFSIEEIFEPTDFLIRKFVEKNAEGELNLKEEIALVEKAFHLIAGKAEIVDPTLVKAILAEQTRQVKTIEQLESRLVRTEKQKHETNLNQLKSVKEKLFPGNGLQERYDNFLPFYLKYGREFFQILKENLDPFDKSFLTIIA